MTLLRAHERDTAQALVNAAVVADAEVYYRNMLFRDELTWNLRDSHSAGRGLQDLKPLESMRRQVLPDHIGVLKDIMRLLA